LTHTTATNPEMSPLKRAFLAVEELQARLRAVEHAAHEPIAVVGLGLRFPGGANDSDSFWQLMQDGVDAIREVPAERWDVDAYFDPDADAPGKMASRWGGFIDNADRFDPQLFGIAPREAASMDPQQRLLLEVTWEALEHAGIAPDSLSTTRTGVFVAISTDDYAQLQLQANGLAGIDAYYASGVAHSIASGRLSYVFGLQGPSVSLDTACSSSLVAVHLAVQSLRSGETNLAVAGGVNLVLSPDVGVTLSRYHMMAADGRCKAFDARADGFVRAEGCGVVVLKKLSQALADGNRVLALIRGTAVNQDGPSSGLTAPNGPSQEAVVREALANGNVAPHAVSYVETHGTGTSLGDPIEVSALGAALGHGRDASDPFAIGSVKTNIGHLEMAAGIAGLIKTILVLQHRQIPPHLHLQQPNPYIDWDNLPITIPTQLTEWMPSTGTRIAGVSSFGFSGTNAHVVLEEAPVAPRGVDVDERPVQLIPLSARTEPALRALAGRYVQHLLDHPDINLGDLAHTAATGRAQLAERVAVAATTSEQARERLAAIASGEQAVSGTVRGRVPAGDPPRVAFLFTGQGAQYPDMGRQLYATQPVFRAALDRCAELLRPHLEYPLLEVLFSGAEGQLDQTAYAQPALFAIEYALAEMWRSWGIEPAVLAGHSVGELTAACIAGVFSLEDGVRLIAARGRLMQALPSGGRMAAVYASLGHVQRAIAADADRVSIAAINGPSHVVISGAGEAVGQLSQDFRADGITVKELRVSHAFHSALIEPMLDEFERIAAGVEFHVPSIRLFSNVTGGSVSHEVTQAAYWRRHARQGVQFESTVRALREFGAEVFVEIGPHPVLLGMAQESVTDDASVAWLPSLRRQRDDWSVLLSSLGALWARGVRVDWAGFERPYAAGRASIALPTYPFERQRHWMVERPALPRPPSQTTSPGAHPLLGQRLRSALRDVQFESELSTDRVAYLRDHRVFGTPILPGAAFFELALAAGRTVLSTTPSEAISLHDVEIHQALVVPDGASRVMQVIVSPEPKGDAGFRIFSAGQPEDPDEWTLHASGQVRSGPAGLPLAYAAVEEIQARCTNERTAEEHYAVLATHGLAFGSSLRGVQHLWWREGEALGKIQLPPAQQSESDRFGLHPALLDACIQPLAAALPGTDSDTYLPVSLDHLRVFGRPGEVVWGHVIARPEGAFDGLASRETRTADVRIFDAAGGIVAELEGLHLKRVGTEGLRRLGNLSQTDEDWLYQVAWQPKPRPKLQSVASPAVALDAQRAAAGKADGQSRLLVYQDSLRHLDVLSAAFSARALTLLGWTPRAGEHVVLHSLAAQLGVQTRHRELLGRLLQMFEEDGLLQSRGPDRVVTRWPSLAETDATIEAETGWLASNSPELRHELATAERCGRGLAEALNGTLDPLQLLFPDGSIADAERLYRDSPLAGEMNSRVADAVDAFVAALPANRPIRILEVGAGTGGTTSYVVPRLPADRTKYTYTDVSPLFLARAKDKFSTAPFVEYRRLDIETDPIAQGFEPDTFDLVVATNVIHATAELGLSLEHIDRLLAPGGVLVLQEMVGRQRWVDISFGMTEGWWRFRDRDLRPDYPLLPRDAWLGVLAAAGFETASPVADLDGTFTADQAIIVARSPGRGVPSRSENDSWLIFSDTAGTGDDLATALREKGARCEVVKLGRADTRLGAHEWRVDPAHLDDELRRLVGDLRAEGRACRNIVHLWSLDAELSSLSTPEEIDETLRLGCGSVLGLVQALAHAGGGESARLWLVTRGAQPVGGEADLALAQAPVWGLANTIALEHPELRCARIDLDPAASDTTAELVEELRAPDAEDQIGIRQGTRYVARLMRSEARRAPVANDEQPAVQLNITERGTLENLVLRPLARRSPGPGEVEIHVQAAGLNFKDVLNALGMYPGDPGPLGGECAGTLVAVGPGVQGLAVGDSVVAVAPGTLRTYVTTSANLVAPMPSGLDFVTAATVPIAFVTADYALTHLARLQPGERVLIHAAAGGVGLAAVQIARRAGAEIFATAGSPEKRAYLGSLDIEHVFDSRSLAFADAIREATGGQGIDVVLNSLAGEFVPRSLGLLRENGRFLELGKRDHLDSEGLARLGQGIQYFLIDWGETAIDQPALIRSVLLDVLSGIGSKSLHPLPRTEFPIDNAAAAFRYMAQAQHTGKVVVSLPPDASARGMVRQDGTYLITGGLSGIGLLAAEWLVEKGARHLVLMGRRGAPEAALPVLERLATSGAQIKVVQGDVSRLDDVERVLAGITVSMPPLRGILHSAGVLDDGVLVQQDWSRFERVFAPKVDGAWHLHTATAALGLDFFVLFSSIAAVLGSSGQGNHAAANAFMDALAHSRRAAGLAGLSVNWGAWADVGSATEQGVSDRIAERGLGLLPPAATLRLLGRLLVDAPPQVAVLAVDWSIYGRQHGAAEQPFLTDVMFHGSVASETPAPPVEVSLATRLASTPTHLQTGLVLTYVREQAALVLDLDPLAIDDRIPLSEMGLDSLMAVELRNLLRAGLGIEGSLPATLAFDYPTLERIANFLVKDILKLDQTADDAEANVELPRNADTTASLGTIEELSDEEVDRLFSLRLGGGR
jgi:acyl transferase domain-containing protein